MCTIYLEGSCVQLVKVVLTHIPIHKQRKHSLLPQLLGRKDDTVSLTRPRCGIRCAFQSGLFARAPLSAEAFPAVHTSSSSSPVLCTDGFPEELWARGSRLSSWEHLLGTAESYRGAETAAWAEAPIPQVRRALPTSWIRSCCHLSSLCRCRSLQASPVKGSLLMLDR